MSLPRKILFLLTPVLCCTTVLYALGMKAQQVPGYETIAGLPVTNSMMTSWVISLLIIVGVRLAVGTPQLVPSKGQQIVEGIVCWLRDLATPIVGKKMVRPTFWLLSGLFFYIIFHNWSGLLPGVGTVGYMDASGHMVAPLIRPANADLNMTLALAVVAQIAWLYYVLRYAGLKVLFVDLFGNKADKETTPVPLYFALFVVFFGVGIIEIISITFRTISLPFRLFGNVYGGENLLHSMSELSLSFLPVATLLPVPFYFLELLIGFVQALVFTLLVAVYIGLICNHGDDHEHAH